MRRTWEKRIFLLLASWVSEYPDLSPDRARYNDFFPIFQVRVVVPFEDIFEILSSASTEIGLCQERIGHPEPRDDPETHLEDLESNMTTFLYLTVILSKIIKVNIVLSFIKFRGF